jgi:hypothetical protein
MIDFRYIKSVKPGTIVYHTYNDISIESFKKLIDKLCISGKIDNQIIIKTDLKMMHIVNVLSLATKRYNIRKNIVIGIINSI